WTGPNSLTFNAFRNIEVGDGATISHTSGSGNLVLRADSTGTGAGTIVLTQFRSGSRIDFTGTNTGSVSFFYNPASYARPTDYTPTGQGGVTRGVTTAIPGQFIA